MLYIYYHSCLNWAYANLKKKNVLNFYLGAVGKLLCIFCLKCPREDQCALHIKHNFHMQKRWKMHIHYVTNHELNKLLFSAHGNVCRSNMQIFETDHDRRGFWCHGGWLLYDWLSEVSENTTMKSLSTLVLSQVAEYEIFRFIFLRYRKTTYSHSQACS